VLKKKVFESWDRFLVPLPPARGLFLGGPPIWIPSGATEAELESKRLEVERALNRVTEQADELVRSEA
jgi:lysophospholipid acyltransferase (LPLAT)-like uncharacterized protein